MGQIDAAKLWQNFMDTVTNHYMDFSGRVGRAQFWYFVLVGAVLGLAVGIVASIVGLWVIGPIFNLALLMPISGMAARRIQDSGQNSQFVWAFVITSAISSILQILFYADIFFGLWAIGRIINLVELVAVIGIIYFGVQPGTPGDNAYGPPPPPWTPGPATP